MSIKTAVLYSMSDRYKQAAKAEKDLTEAEKLTAKAIEYYDAWMKAVRND